MGVLKRFEQRLEGLVNGTFAKVFKSEVQPVEIAGALQRECDNNATIWNRERTVVPNDFIVELSPSDYQRLAPYAAQLGDELASMVREYAKQQRYTFMGEIRVHLAQGESLDTGLYRVRSRTLAASSPGSGPAAPTYGAAAPPPPPSQPPPRPPGPAGPSGAPGQGGYGYPPRPPQPAPGYPAAAGSPPYGARQNARVRRWVEINGTRHQISRASLVIGRSTEADVRIDDPGVSRRHCEIQATQPATVRDLGSTNGIVVDGQHTKRATLRDGSRIVVGSTTVIYRQAEG
ncbi:FhaA domain-containing protein [Streptomyces sp. 4N509B]|uniref:FhaA domain-containing protein n=1 Tax=Streptomyces sp. 4N509B TaxID=3457413 RepID=UPI003FD55EA1